MCNVNECYFSYNLHDIFSAYITGQYDCSNLSEMSNQRDSLFLPPPKKKIIKLGLERQRPSIKTLINVRLIRLFTTSLFVHNVER